FSVNLLGSTGASISPSQASGSGRVVQVPRQGGYPQNPTLPSLSFPYVSTSSATVTAAAVGTTEATLSVSLAMPYNQTVVVDYATADGTARAGADYVAIPLTPLTFAPGQTVQTVTVTIEPEPGFDAARTFTINLTAPPGGNCVIA